MPKHALRLLGFILLGCIVFAGGLWVLEMALEDRDAKYEGATISDWIDRLKSPGVTANTALVTVTNRVIPALCDRMFNDTNDSQLKLKLVGALNSLPWGNVNAAEADARRYTAAQQLGEFGTNAATAVPALIKCAKSEDFARGGAIEALGKIHSEPSIVVPFLTQYLDDPDEDTKIGATVALGEFGPAAKSAVPKLIPLLTFHSKELPYRAKIALEAIDPFALNTNKAAISP